MHQVMFLAQERLLNSINSVLLERKTVLSRKKVLVIEEDYVNYLLIEELILSAGGNVYRVLDINEAVDFLGSIHHIDLIVINISLILATQNEIVHYLKKEYSVPVVVVLDNNVECKSLKVVDWFDCAVSINLDANSLCETLVELVNNTCCKTVT